MTRKSSRRGAAPRLDGFGMLDALPHPVLAVDAAGNVLYVNHDGEAFFDESRGSLVGRRLDTLLPADSPIHDLARQAIAQNSSVSEYGVALETPRIGRHLVNASAGPMGDPPSRAVLMLRKSSVAQRIDNQLTHRGAARSVAAMAAMLAHEVKNPLSGIRGAAQLLDETVDENDRQLTRLICDEADRIVALVDRMDMFNQARLDRAPVNIHSVLERVRKVSQTGFARHVRIIEHYDPSLPAVQGDYDQLVQVFLNLVKNAAEACPSSGGEIVIKTRYQRGVSVAIPGTGSRVHLPLAVSIQDNGSGIPDDLQEHLFDPFVTSKQAGTGLGLALVAKVVGDHGGVVGFESHPRRTMFTVSLPLFPDPAAETREVRSEQVAL